MIWPAICESDLNFTFVLCILILLQFVKPCPWLQSWTLITFGRSGFFQSYLFHSHQDVWWATSGQAVQLCLIACKQCTIVQVPYWATILSQGEQCPMFPSEQLSAIWGLFSVNQVYRKLLLSLKRNIFVDHVLKI